MLEAAVICLATLAQVHLRGGEGAPAGQVVAVDASGVLLGVEGAEAGPKPGTPATAAKPQVGSVLIGWDRVRSVQGPQAEAAAEFLPVADMAWRARTRLERGDAIAAEPLFERLFEFYRGQEGPTAAVVAEGLLRCRISRAAHVAAVDPWLSLLKASAAGKVSALHPAWAAEAGLAPVLDPATGLVPALPPIWLSWPSIDAFARGTESAGAGGELSDRAAVLAAVYAAAARFEAGLPAVVPEVRSTDPGVQLVVQILKSRIGGPEEREASRGALRDRLATARGGAATPAWVEAWCRAAIGRSLLRESEPERRKHGVVELLHVPAEFGGVHPYLAGVALAESSAALRAMGDTAGADVLARELVRNYPSHPVSDWAAIRPHLPRPQTVLSPRPSAAEEPADLQPDGGAPAERDR